MDGWGALVCVLLAVACVGAVAWSEFRKFWRDAATAFTPPDDRKDLS